MAEVWKPLVRFEGRYEVSSKGRLRSVDRVSVDAAGKKRRLQGVVLQVNSNGAGYLCARLGRGAITMVHTAVAEAFLGPRPPGHQVRHKRPGSKTDNRLCNLEYGTPKANQNDRRRHGTHIRGEKAWNALLTAADVRRIRRLAPTRTYQSLAEEYGVSKPTVTAVVTRRNWAHLKD
jgi:hypothetical protein